MLHEYECVFLQGLTRHCLSIQNLNNKITETDLLSALGKTILFITWAPRSNAESEKYDSLIEAAKPACTFCCSGLFSLIMITLKNNQEIHINTYKLRKVKLEMGKMQF